MRVLNLEQGSDDWSIWRNCGIGSSSAYIITNLAPREWGLSRTRLYEEMTGLRPRVYTRSPAMKRGLELEPFFRDWLRKKLRVEVVPQCVVSTKHEWLRSSLDGMSADRRTIAEFKFANATVHGEALERRVVPYYYAQLQHHLLVTELPEVYYLTYNDQSFQGAERVALVRVKANPAYQKRLLEVEQEFWNCVQARRPPGEYWVGWYRPGGTRKWVQVYQSLSEQECHDRTLEHAEREGERVSDLCILPHGKHPSRHREQRKSLKPTS